MQQQRTTNPRCGRWVKDNGRCIAGIDDAGRFYVLDRGHAKYKLLQQIIDAESNFACRIKDDSVFEIIEERQLNSDSLQAGIRRDMIVRLGCESTKEHLKQPVRVIQLKTTEQTQYSSHTLPYRGRKPPETMLICTDRLDLPAATNHARTCQIVAVSRQETT